jgi:hypothetical protein
MSEISKIPIRCYKITKKYIFNLDKVFWRFHFLDPLGFRFEFGHDG